MCLTITISIALQNISTNSITCSTQPLVKKRLDKHPIIEIDLLPEPIAIGGVCALCNRSRILTYTVFLQGDEYDKNKLIDTRRFNAATNAENIAGILDSSHDGYSHDGIAMDIGRHCMSRIEHFHEAQHYKYHLYQNIKVECKDAMIKLRRTRRVSSKQQVGSINGKELNTIANHIYSELDNTGKL